MKTVKMKMALLFGILMVIMCLGLAIAGLITSENALIDKAENSMESLAVQAGKTVEAELSNHINALDSLSYCAMLGGMESDSTEISEGNMIKLLSEEANRGGYLHVAYADNEGNALYEDGSHKDIKAEAYYQKALAGETAVTEPVFSDSGELIMTYAVPVKRDNSTVGVLLGVRNGLELGALAGGTANGETGSAFIINGKGNTIAHSNETMMQSIIDTLSVSGGNSDEESADEVSSATQEKTVEASSTPKLGDNLLGYTDFDELQRAMTAGETGSGEYNYNGTGKVMGYAPIKGYGWSIGLEIDRKEILSGIDQLIRNFIIIGIIFLIPAIVIVYVASMRISKPIEYLTGICYQISKGDYSIEPEEKYRIRKDEMGRLATAFHEITDSTKGLLRENADVAGKISESSRKLDYMIQQFSSMMKEISTALEQISAGNMEQAEGTQQGAQQVNDMQLLIEHEQQNMLGLQNSADKVEHLKGEGLTIMEDLAQKTKISKSMTSEINQVFMEMNESAGKIADISHMIGGITGQTRLLALNASIEAARAGESGKGFAIVAKEVEALSGDTDRLSKEIARVVEELGVKSASSIHKIDEINGSVLKQTKSVEMTLSKFRGIAEAIEETRSNIQVLNQSIDNMDYKKNEVVKIIMELSATSQENASGTQEVSVSVQEQASYMEQIAGLSKTLSDMAGELDTYIRKYKF